MTLTSKPLAMILLLVMFGGIMFSSIMGWWVTESTKIPTTFTDGEFAGQANPADIRGSYTFGDIARSFDVAPDVLAQAFGIQQADPATFVVKDLESIFADSGYEIGTTSIRLFVAYYAGLPFDTAGQDIYLPQSAVKILSAKGNLALEQLDYLEKHAVDNAGTDSAKTEIPTPTSTATAASATSVENVVKGKTTFGELVAWGVSQSTIENLIGASLPDATMTIKDYATAKGLNFETLKSALQAEVDKVKP